MSLLRCRFIVRVQVQVRVLGLGSSAGLGAGSGPGTESGQVRDLYQGLVQIPEVDSRFGYGGDWVQVSVDSGERPR